MKDDAPTKRYLAGLSLALALAPAHSSAQTLPPVSARMMGRSALACIMIADSGAINGAYLLSTSGDEATDADMLAWTKQLHWDPAKPGEKMRNTWFPIGLAFGGATATPPHSSANRS
jgi:hypothetical protein